MNWSKLIKQIMSKPLEEPGGGNWRLEDIGAVVGLSTSTIGRMSKYPGTNEPKHSKGEALIALHQAVMDGQTYSSIKSQKKRGRHARA